MLTHRACVLLAIACALLPYAIPASADLSFSGKAPHEALFRRTFAALPPRYRTVDVTVHEVAAADWPAVEKRAGVPCTGYFREDERATWIRSDMDEAELTATLDHEASHAVWYQSLTGAERAGWTAFYVGHRALMPCAFARQRDTEGWAWSCQFFLTGAPLNPEVETRIRALLEDPIP